MNVVTSRVPMRDRGTSYMLRERFEVDQYVRVRVTETRYSIGVVTHIDEGSDQATVETRNGYEVTVPISALRRAFLLVLDLNGVLVARGRGSFILRPHVLDFLKFVFSNFVVAVWTSGLQRSSNPIIDHVFGSYRDLLLFTLFREACIPKPSLENPYGTEKNLQVIFDRYPQSFHSVNTIIIDDSPSKCSHPDIALCPIPFKDPVAQQNDEGLLQTMATLKEVLELDSGAPLIIAAEQRLQQLAEQQRGTLSAAKAAQPHDGAPPALSQQRGTTAVTPTPALTERDATTDMEEVELWKTRLCCDHLQGRCPYGTQCPFSHDPDDGRPCSRKSGCPQHRNRWPKTSEETLMEEHRRQTRRTMPRKDSSMPRQRGARAPRAPQQLQHRKGNRDDQRDSHKEEGADWADATVGFSHTGDPAYDNMIEQQRRSGATATKTPAKAPTTPGRSSAVASQRVHHDPVPARTGVALPDHGAPATGWQSEPQPPQQPESTSVSRFFQTAIPTFSTAPPLEPFSTRPIPLTSTFQVSTVFACSPRPSSADVAKVASHPPPQGGDAAGDRQQRRNQRESGGERKGRRQGMPSDSGRGTEAALQDRHQRQQAPSSRAAQPIRISGAQGDSTAVVSQLQALLGKR